MTDELKSALYDLVAIERDRQLGYADSELHMDPQRALQNALDALEEHGDDPSEIVWDDDAERLNLEV